MNHQAIIDRLHQLEIERYTAIAKVNKPFEAERASLQELCGGLGHLWEKVFDRCVVCRCLGRDTKHTQST